MLRCSVEGPSDSIATGSCSRLLVPCCTVRNTMSATHSSHEASHAGTHYLVQLGVTSQRQAVKETKATCQKKVGLYNGVTAVCWPNYHHDDGCVLALQPSSSGVTRG